VRFAPLLPSDAASVRPEAIAARRVTARWRAAALGCLLLGIPLAAQAAPFLWDEDGDRVDDRIETVHLLGYSFAFEQQDTLARMRIGVTRVAADLAYSLYVVYDHADEQRSDSAPRCSACGALSLRSAAGVPQRRDLRAGAGGGELAGRRAHPGDPGALSGAHGAARRSARVIVRARLPTRYGSGGVMARAR
jgi:hypothetical protein